MADLSFASIDKRGYRELETWFGDTELQRRYGRPTRNWLRYVQLEPSVYAWMAYENKVLSVIYNSM